VRFYFVIEVTSMITEMFFACTLYLISECSNSACSFSPAFRNEIGICIFFFLESKVSKVLKHKGVIEANSLRDHFFVKALLSS